MAGGKFIALQEGLQSQTDFTADLLAHEDQEFRHRAEDRLIADRTKAEVDALEAKRKKEADEFTANLEKTYIKPTGYKSHDEPLIKFFTKEGGLLDVWNQTFNDLVENPNNQEILTRQFNLNKSIETLRGLRDGMVERGDFLQEGLQNGTFSPSLNRGVIDNYNKLINDYQYDYKLNERGEIFIENKAYDPDGDGIPNELTLQDVYDPEIMKLHGYFDVREWAKSTKPFYGKMTTVTDKDGFKREKLIGFDITKTDDLILEVEQLFGKDLLTMTPEAKSFINDSAGLDYRQFTQSEFDDIKTNLISRLINAYDRTAENTIDSGARISAARENRLSQEKSPKNSLRTTVDGIIAGDDQYLQSLVDQKLEEQGSDGKDVYIRKAEFSRGRIILELTGGKMIEIHTSNKKEAIAKVLKLVRPNDKPDLRLAEYEKGVSEKEFAQNTNQNISVIGVEKIMKNLPTQKASAIRYLNKEGITEFKTAGGYFDSIIEDSSGNRYDLDKKEDREKLKQRLITGGDSRLDKLPD